MVYFFRLIRWTNLLIIVFTLVMARVFIVGYYEDLEESLYDPIFRLIVLSTVLIAAAGYIINDYFDIKIDLINKPNKVIIGKHISRRIAIVLHQLLNLAGVACAYFVNLKVFFISILSATLLMLYAAIFKKTALLGNIIIAFLTASSLIMLSVTYSTNDLFLNMYALFAFSITLVRELIKDMEDIEGDKTFGCRTLPIVWGISKTKSLVILFIGIFMVLIFSMGFAIKNKSIIYIFVALCGLLLYLIIKLIPAEKAEEFHKLSQYCKYLMLFGVCSMAAL